MNNQNQTSRIEERDYVRVKPSDGDNFKEFIGQVKRISKGFIVVSHPVLNEVAVEAKQCEFIS